MRQTKRKFVALSTALAMALVLVASLVPSFGAKAAPQVINEVTINFTAPKVGDTATAYNDTKVKVEVPDGAIYNSPEGFLQDSEGGELQFPLTFEEGKEYYYRIFVYPNEDGGVIFPINLDTGKPIEGEFTLNVNGATFVNYEYCGDTSLQFVVKFTPGGSDQGGDDQGGDDQGGGSDQGGSADQGDSGQSATSTSNIVTLTNGASATVAQADHGTVSFRSEKDFSYFENGGKLYIDGEEVPSDQYTARQGSTIITLLKQYASKLLDGKEHTVKAVFKDGEAIESKITVKPSAAANATTATTTKTTAPKTADVLPIAGIALVFVGATAIGVIAFRRKNL